MALAMVGKLRRDTDDSSQLTSSSQTSTTRETEEETPQQPPASCQTQTLSQGNQPSRHRGWLSAVAIAGLLGSVLAAWCVVEQVRYGRSPWFWQWGRIPPAELQPEMCNTKLWVPRVDWQRKWRLDAATLAQCELKNKHHFPWQYPHDRNWCWIGFKAVCHSHLKAHLSWGSFQAMGAHFGRTVSPAEWRFEPLEDPEVCDRPSNGRTGNWTPVQRSMAREWLRMYVRVYVLNMPDDTKRWEMIAGRLRELRIEAKRVFGVDMRGRNVMTNAKAAGWVLEGYNFSKAQETAYSGKHSMGSILGTLGCASAHFKVQSQAIADGGPLAVVFEDDSWPEEDFVERLWSLVHTELPCDWEVVSLMSRCPYGKCVSPHLTRVQPDNNEPAWRCHQGVNWGMQGVLYRIPLLEKVQRKWKQQVFNESRPHCLDVDVALASISDRVAVYAVPASQDPGFLKETNHPSARWTINVAGRTQHQLDIDPNNIG
eukprot:CAMPEP_0175206832 /NCGR_PEP_ID=MMETSP0093-20121207/12798_1 /TAXON_ID=311494 /ORGANISM="Alexandrium monilatum, Strain CCMP3105" /LENGTH=482 /DNA_ID=CAMNT_0016499973 /DNA_START=38 /DNA_END=1486 /DNA_ORIENTATION=-